VDVSGKRKIHNVLDAGMGRILYTSIVFHTHKFAHLYIQNFALITFPIIVAPVNVVSCRQIPVESD
jgi:hypothetical protein